MDLYAHLFLICWTGILHIVSFDLTVFELYTVGNLLQVMGRHILVKEYMIDLLLQILRMGQLGSQITIIRQQKNTSCIAVKASYGIDTLWTSILHKIHHSLTLLGIVTRRHVILRFVQQDVYLLLNLDRLVVEHHCICAQYLGSQLCHNLTINSDDTCLDKLICLTTTATSSCYTLHSDRSQPYAGEALSYRDY